jgi:hypothetical protein
MSNLDICEGDHREWITNKRESGQGSEWSPTGRAIGGNFGDDRRRSEGDGDSAVSCERFGRGARGLQMAAAEFFTIEERMRHA